MAKWQKKRDFKWKPLASVWSYKSNKDGSWYGLGSFSKFALEGVDKDHFINNLQEYSVSVNKVTEKQSDKSPDFMIKVTLRDDAKLRTHSGDEDGPGSAPKKVKAPYPPKADTSDDDAPF